MTIFELIQKNKEQDALYLLKTTYVDPHAVDKTGDNVVQSAAKKGYCSLIEKLLYMGEFEKHFDFNKKFETLLTIASKNNSMELLWMIVKHPRSSKELIVFLIQDLKKTSELPVIEFFCKRFNLDINVQMSIYAHLDKHHNTAIHLAVLANNQLQLAHQLSIGANPYSPNKNRLHALSLAIINQFHDCVKMILDSNNNISMNFGSSLTSAISSNNLDLVKILCEKVDKKILTRELNLPTFTGLYGIQLAVQNQNCDMVKELLQYGADPFQLNEQYDSAFLMAHRKKYGDILGLIIKHHESNLLNKPGCLSDTYINSIGGLVDTLEDASHKSLCKRLMDYKSTTNTPKEKWLLLADCYHSLSTMQISQLTYGSFLYCYIQRPFERAFNNGESFSLPGEPTAIGKELFICLIDDHFKTQPKIKTISSITIEPFKHFVNKKHEEENVVSESTTLEWVYNSASEGLRPARRRELNCQQPKVITRKGIGFFINKKPTDINSEYKNPHFQLSSAE